MAEETKKAETGKEDSSAKGADTGAAAAKGEQQEVNSIWLLFWQTIYSLPTSFIAQYFIISLPFWYQWLWGFM